MATWCQAVTCSVSLHITEHLDCFLAPHGKIHVTLDNNVGTKQLRHSGFHDPSIQDTSFCVMDIAGVACKPL